MEKNEKNEEDAGKKDVGTKINLKSIRVMGGLWTPWDNLEEPEEEPAEKEAEAAAVLKS